MMKLNSGTGSSTSSPSRIKEGVSVIGLQIRSPEGQEQLLLQVAKHILQKRSADRCGTVIS